MPKMCAYMCSVVSESFATWCPWNFPDRNTGVSCHALLQGIFLTQESSLCLLCLLHWQVDSLPLHHLGSNVQDTYFKKYKNVKTIYSINWVFLTASLIKFIQLIVLCLVTVFICSQHPSYSFFHATTSHHSTYVAPSFWSRHREWQKEHLWVKG